jgi:(p)ppGpp synthase/HD superfamily hydrolase
VRAFRVIVADDKTCYTVLGLVHNIWTPIPKEFDDYISRPKPNGYQSLHTVVMADDGRPLEVQIRTQEMHNFAEYGIAAHWRYKEEGGSNFKGQKYDEKIAWLRQLLAWKTDVADAVVGQEESSANGSKSSSRPRWTTASSCSRRRRACSNCRSAPRRSTLPTTCTARWATAAAARAWTA